MNEPSVFSGPEVGICTLTTTGTQKTAILHSSVVYVWNKPSVLNLLEVCVSLPHHQHNVTDSVQHPQKHAAWDQYCML